MPAQVFAAESNDFGDIKGHWAEESISMVVQAGLFKGSSESKFEPQGSMTRAMFITVLHRLSEKLDGPDVVLKDQRFTDVPPNAWYANAITWAKGAGLTEGYGNGTFGPNDLLNREQITVLMIRFLTTYMGYDLSNYQSSDLFADNEQISSWAKEAVYQAVALGLIKGETENTFNPTGKASRAVVAVITERFLEKSAELKVDKPAPTPTPSTPSTPSRPSTPTPSTPSTPTPTPTPTTPSTPAPTPPSGESNGDDEGSSTIKVTDATIQRNDKEVTGAVIRSGDELTVAVTPSDATKTVKWFVSDKLKKEADTYTVESLDVGSVITAEVTGTGAYSDTVTSLATGTVIASVYLTNKDVNSTPVVVSDDVIYMDKEGNEITLNDTDPVSFSITASETEVPQEEKENVAATLEKEFADANAADLAINYFAIDAKLLVESEDNTSTEIHPVGKTTLTLSKANLGLKSDEDISQHIFLIGHTNKKGEQENSLGEVVEINGEQFVRVELNGLSTVYIGNIPPLTLTFDTDGGSLIEPKKVKLGEITPAVDAPTKDGYFFNGWNVDLNKTPIYMDMTIKALWLEGAYVPENRLSLVDAKGDKVKDYSFGANGIVKVLLSESVSYDADLNYMLNITAADNAAKYALRDSAEAATSAKVEDAVDVNGYIIVPITITDKDAKVITGNHSSFVKWFNEDGQVINLESVTVAVETDERAATREQTFAVNRGVGTVEAVLLATSDETEDYYSYLNGYLSGDAVYNNYALSLNASFEKNIYGQSEKPVQIDYNNYSGLKLTFTPFKDESYEHEGVKASGYYWDENGKQQYIDLDAKLSNEGLLEVTTKADQNLKEMAGTSNYLYLYITAEANGRKQQVNINIQVLSENVGANQEYISTDEWTEVVAALEENSPIYISYYGEAITLNKLLELKKNQYLSITNSNFTIGSGGELQLVGTDNGGSYVSVNKDIIVANGGKITTNSQLDSQKTYYGTSVYSDSTIRVEQGGEISVPERGFLSIQGKSGLLVQQDGAINVKGNLSIRNNAELNGALNIIGSNENYTTSLKGYVNVYGDLTINKMLDLSNNGYVSVSGMTTIQENSELRLSKGNMSLNGKTYNHGKIAVQEGDLTLSNIGYAVNNDGIIDLAASARLIVPGTTLVNNKTISGSGTVILKEEINAAANYKNGIEYVTIQGAQSPSKYSRYQFVSDPAATVTGIIYESKISGTGIVAQEVNINEIKIPENGQTGIALSYEDDISTTDIEDQQIHVIEVKIPE